MQRPAMQSGMQMAIAATLVVAFYAAGVASQGAAAAWYEWAMAALGAGFAAWFWLTELQRARRRGKK